MKGVIVDRCELAGGSVRMPDIQAILLETIKANNPSFISFVLIIMDYLTLREVK